MRSIKINILVWFLFSDVNQIALSWPAAVLRPCILVGISWDPLWDRVSSPLSISNNTDYSSSGRCGRRSLVWWVGVVEGGWEGGVFTPFVSESYARTHASHRQGLPNGLITISIIVMDHLLERWKTFWCGFDIPWTVLKHLITLAGVR